MNDVRGVVEFGVVFVILNVGKELVNEFFLNLIEKFKISLVC